MSEEEMPTFVAGDVVELHVHLEHSMNIAQVSVRFVNRAPRPGMWQGDVAAIAELLDPDEGEGEGTVASFDLLIEADHFPGLYELDQLRVRTSGGALQDLGADLLPIEFLVEEEPKERVTVRNWRLE